MADSKLETVIAAIAARLATITQSNGYETDIGLKVFDWLPVEKMETGDLPCVSVQHPSVTINRQPSSVWRQKPEIVVIAMNASATDSAKQARKAAADIIAAVGTDKTFGGLVFDCDFNTVEFDVQQKDKITAAVKVSFKIGRSHV